MRICLINYEYPPLGGGAGNATANLARELADLGADVLVLTSAFRGLPAREVDSFEIRRLPTLRLRPDRCSVPEMLAFLASGLTMGLYAMDRFKPDVNIAFFGLPSGPIAWAARLLGGVPYLVSLRGGDVPGFQPRDMRLYHLATGPVIRHLWKKAKAVVGNSQGLVDLARRFEPGLDFELIPNGVNMGAFACPKRRVKLPDEALKLVFVGRLADQKGLDLLFTALGGLLAQQWKLTLIGDGPQRGLLADMAEKGGFAQRVEFRGWASKQDVARALAEADLFVFPSRDEGMPNALLEAMASGLPCIATRISGNEELVADEVTGWLIPPEDTAALAQALDKALRARNVLPDMGQEACERARTRYTWTLSAKHYLELCHKAAGC